MIWHRHVVDGHAVDRRIEMPERILRDPRRDLGAEAGCETILMHDHASPGLADRFQQTGMIPRRNRSEVDELDDAVTEPRGGFGTAMDHRAPADHRDSRSL